MEYLMYYLVFTAGALFGACCMAMINYRRNNNEENKI